MAILANIIRQKQLSNSLFRGQWTMVKDEIPEAITKEDIKALVIREFVKQLLSKMLTDNELLIVDNPDGSGKFIRYECQLLVFPMADFKSIVEAAIQLLSDQQIEQIKLGQTVL